MLLSTILVNIASTFYSCSCPFDIKPNENLKCSLERPSAQCSDILSYCSCNEYTSLYKRSPGCLNDGAVYNPDNVREYKAENPKANMMLIQSPSEGDKAMVQKLITVDPSIKSNIWHFAGVTRWSKDFWTGSNQLKNVFEKPYAGINTYIDALGSWRNFIATYSETELSYLFGSRRNGLSVTPLGGQYVTLRLTPNGQTTAGYFDSLNFHSQWNGEKTTYTDPVYNIKHLEYFYSETFLDFKGYEVKLLQTVTKSPADYVPKGWHVLNSFSDPLVNKLLDRVLQDTLQNAKAKENIQSFTKRVATLHWLMANICPYDRGSAAVGDLLSSSLFLLRGYHWQGWAESVSADVTALCMADLAEYQRVYSTLMYKPLVPIE